MVRKLAVALLTALVVAACSDGGFQRGVFYGKVIDRTPEEVAKNFGKPESIDSTVPDSPKYVYARKTFNPENQNQIDDKTIVEFARNKEGKVVCTDVSYM